MAGVVLDANVVVTLAIGGPKGQVFETQLEDWLADGVELYAPDLAKYEIANAFTRAVAAGGLDSSLLPKAFEGLANLPIVYHPCPSGERVVEVALQLQRSSAYDAAYLALAELLQAELWTLGGRLLRNTIEYGFAV